MSGSTIAVAAQESPAVAARRLRNTVHLFGPGAVGRAVLERMAASRRTLVAVTDSSATVFDPGGLDARAIGQWKAAGHRLSAMTGARVLPAQDAVALADADIVIDAAATDLRRAGWTDALQLALDRGARLVLAAKGALCLNAAAWLHGTHADRVGCNAVLGGTGHTFIADLPELRRRWRSVAIVGNASTTTIIQVVERGGSVDDGIAEAARLGYLEADPEDDLRGQDAAIKLAIVAGALTGRRFLPDDMACDDVRDIAVGAVRARARRGATTRLVARLDAAAGPRVSCEEVPLDSVLAARCGQVVYDYRLAGGERRIHIGGGLGPEATAGALWADVQALAGLSAGASLRAGSTVAP